MLFTEILGQNTGLVTYNPNTFSLYLAGTPVIMPFAWFALLGFTRLLSRGPLSSLRAFGGGILLDLLLELPFVNYGTWSNNFGRIHIVPGYPLILPFLYGFYASWFTLLLRHLVPRLEQRNIRSSELLFAFVYIPSLLGASSGLVAAIPL